LPVAGNPSSDTYSVDLKADSGGHVFHLFVGAGNTRSTYSVCLSGKNKSINIVGQLPEVPFAAALPVVGLGAAVGLWAIVRRRGNSVA
jgi:hypothetical protein